MHRIPNDGSMSDECRSLRDRPEDTGWTEVPAHRSIANQDLLGGERVIVIRHGGDEYRLRLTASGKLILTK
jgi:hemin uptake protein HemP